MSVFHIWDAPHRTWPHCTVQLWPGNPRGPHREPPKDFDPAVKCLGCSLCGLHGTCDTPVRPARVSSVTVPSRSAPPSLYVECLSSPPPPQCFLFLQASGPCRKAAQSSSTGLVPLPECANLLAHRRGLTSPPSLHPAPFPKPHSTPQSPHWNTQTEAQRPGDHAPTFPVD